MDAFRPAGDVSGMGAASEKEEDPVPDFVRYVEEFDHKGVKNADDPDTGWELPPKDQGVVVAPRARRLRIDANAIIHVPDGVAVRTRWVSWSGRDDPGWVRGPARRHESNEAETGKPGTASNEEPGPSGTRVWYLDKSPNWVGTISQNRVDIVEVVKD